MNCHLLHVSSITSITAYTAPHNTTVFRAVNRPHVGIGIVIVVQWLT